MYNAFFGFRESPFNLSPDPSFFYRSPQHEEALANLIYGVHSRKGFIVLTGEVGYHEDDGNDDAFYGSAKLAWAPGGDAFTCSRLPGVVSAAACAFHWSTPK